MIFLPFEALWKYPTGTNQIQFVKYLKRQDICKNDFLAFWMISGVPNSAPPWSLNPQGALSTLDKLIWRVFDMAQNWQKDRKYFLPGDTTFSDTCSSFCLQTTLPTFLSAVSQVPNLKSLNFFPAFAFSPYFGCLNFGRPSVDRCFLSTVAVLKDCGRKVLQKILHKQEKILLHKVIKKIILIVMQKILHIVMQNFFYVYWCRIFYIKWCRKVYT